MSEAAMIKIIITWVEIFYSVVGTFLWVGIGATMFVQGASSGKLSTVIGGLLVLAAFIATVFTVLAP